MTPTRPDRVGSGELCSPRTIAGGIGSRGVHRSKAAMPDRAAGHPSRVPDLVVAAGRARVGLGRGLSLGGFVLFVFEVVDVVVDLGLGAVDALVRDVVEGLQVLLPVLAGEKAFLDVALDRAAVIQARGLRVL